MKNRANVEHFTATWSGLKTRHRVTAPHSPGLPTVCGLTTVPASGADYSDNAEKKPCTWCERAGRGVRLYTIRNGRRVVLS